MKIVNLNSLKIEDEHDFKITSLRVQLNPSDFESIKSIDLATIKAAIEMACMLEEDDTAKDDCVDIRFNFYVDDVDVLTEDNFETLVHLVNSNFLGKEFLMLENEKGRKRERRLDVPISLLGVHTSKRIVKNMVNEVTLVDRFNMFISLEDKYMFRLVDKESVEVGESIE